MKDSPITITSARKIEAENVVIKQIEVDDDEGERASNKMRREDWEMINPEYINPMFPPSPSDQRSISQGRFSTSSPNAQSMSPWRLLPFNSPDTRPFRCVASMIKPGGHIYSMAVAPDGLLYTGSDSQNIRVWSHTDFPQHSCLKSGSGNVKALLVVGEQVLSAHGDNKIRLWRRSRSNPNVHTRVATLPKFSIVQTFIRPLVTDSGTGRGKHSGPVTCLACDPNDDLLYSGSSDKSVKVWNVCDPNDDLLYSGSSDKSVKVWNVSESKCIETVEAHTDSVNAVVVRHDGLLFTGSDDGTVKVWRRPGRGRRTHELIMTLNMQRSPVKAIALGPLGPDCCIALYAGCYDGYIHYWEEDQFSDRILHYCGFLRGHLHSVLCLVTVRDLLLSGSADTTIRVWKRDGGGTGICCVAVMEGHSGPVKCIAATTLDLHDNSFVAYSGSLDGMVKVWMGRLKTTTDPRPTSPVRIR